MEKKPKVILGNSQVLRIGDLVFHLKKERDCQRLMKYVSDLLVNFFERLQQPGYQQELAALLGGTEKAALTMLRAVRKLPSSEALLSLPMLERLLCERFLSEAVWTGQAQLEEIN